MSTPSPSPVTEPRSSPWRTRRSYVVQPAASQGSALHRISSTRFTGGRRLAWSGFRGRVLLYERTADARASVIRLRVRCSGAGRWGPRYIELWNLATVTAAGCTQPRDRTARAGWQVTERAVQLARRPAWTCGCARARGRWQPTSTPRSASPTSGRTGRREAADDPAGAAARHQHCRSRPAAGPRRPGRLRGLAKRSTSMTAMSARGMNQRSETTPRRMPWDS